MHQFDSICASKQGETKGHSQSGRKFAAAFNLQGTATSRWLKRRTLHEGDPDGGLLIAIVETKKIGAGDLAGKKDFGYKEQFDRYKAAYQTIAFTDFLDFHFYGNGAFSDSVRIGEVVGDGIRPFAENFGKFVALIERLGDAEPQTNTSPTQLARRGSGRRLSGCERRAQGFGLSAVSKMPSAARTGAAR